MKNEKQNPRKDKLRQTEIRKPLKADKNQRSYGNLLLAIFLLTIFTVMTVNLIIPDKTYSEVENRSLAQGEAFTPDSLFRTNFHKKFGTWFEDQFIGRDSFIGIKALMDKFTLRQENNGVYINNGQYLLEKFDRNPPEVTKEKATAINTFVKAHPDKNIYMMLVPTKTEVLSGKLPFMVPEDSQSDYIKDFYSELTVDLKKINVTQSLKDHKDQYIFFRTDHHWTQRAAYLAYREFMKSVGFEPTEEGEYEIKKVDNNFLGTLANKAGLVPGSPDEIDLYVPRKPEEIIVNIVESKEKFTSLYMTDKLSERDKYLVYLGGNYPVVRINTSSKNDKRLLIIKDSYANSFVPFLTSAFNEITMVDLRYYSGDVNKLLDDYNITDVLFLYNVATFNDDSSILNITDSLVNTKPEEETNN